MTANTLAQAHLLSALAESLRYHRCRFDTPVDALTLTRVAGLAKCLVSAIERDIEEKRDAEPVPVEAAESLDHILLADAVVVS